MEASGAKNKTTIFLVESEIQCPALDQVHQFYSKENNYEVSRITLDSADSVLENKRSCLFIFTIENYNQVPKFQNFSQNNRQALRSKKVLAMALLKQQSQRAEESLLRMGCSEVMPFTVTFKALNHKISKFLKLLDLSKSEKEETEVKFVDLSGNMESISFKRSSDLIEFGPGLESTYDFWLFRKKYYVKKFMNNWITELIGPSPNEGKWVQNDQYGFLFKSEAPTWEWVPKDAGSPFDASPAKWVFHGNEPEYSWIINRWAFYGSMTELALVDQGKITHSKFKALTHDRIFVSQNSSFVRSIFEKITLTFDRTYRFINEKSTIPWSDKIDSLTLGPGDRGQSKSNEEPSSSELDPVSSIESHDSEAAKLITAKGYRVTGTLNHEDIEVLGFGNEKGVIFLGSTRDFVKELEAVVLRVSLQSATKPLQLELFGNVAKIHEIHPEKYIFKIQIGISSITLFEGLKRSFFVRQKEIQGFIEKAKGTDTLESTASESSLTALSEEDVEVAAKFIKNSHILILDSVSAARINLAATLVNIGASRTNMSLVGTISEAIEVVEKFKPKIIFSDYMIGSSSGLDFIRKIRADFAQIGITDSIHLLISSNATQTAVAKAAEGEVDGYIIKPYTIDGLRNSIIRFIKDKINPSPYLTLINHGIDMFTLGELDQAEQYFNQALQHDPKPALALSYLGKISARRNQLDLAEEYLRKGILCNPIHFNCLNELQDLLFKQTRYHDAYEVAQDLVRFFPANTKRLSSIFRSAILTDNFNDILNFYQVYLSLDERDDELIRHVCSALIVGGKYFLKLENQIKALELFEKAAISTGPHIRFYYYIIEALVHFKLGKESERFMQRLSFADPNSHEYEAAQYLMNSLTLSSIDTVYQGRLLLQKGVVEFAGVYECLIFHSVQQNYLNEAKELARVASEKWPDRAAQFQYLLNTPKG